MNQLISFSVSMVSSKVPSCSPQFCQCWCVFFPLGNWENCSPQFLRTMWIRHESTQFVLVAMAAIRWRHVHNLCFSHSLLSVPRLCHCHKLTFGWGFYGHNNTEQNINQTKSLNIHASLITAESGAVDAVFALRDEDLDQSQPSVFGIESSQSWARHLPVLFDIV